MSEGLGIRFSKNMFPQSELLEHQEPSKSESFEIHQSQEHSESTSPEQQNESILTQDYEPVSSRGYEQASQSEFHAHHNESITTRPHRSHEHHEYQPKSFPKYVPRRYILGADIANEDQASDLGRRHNSIRRGRRSRSNSKAEGDSDQGSPIDHEIARWSRYTPTAYSPTSYPSPSSSQYSPQSHYSFSSVSNEARLSHWSAFFSTESLMRCLDTAEENQCYDGLLFESLLSEVKEPLPAETIHERYRGVVQIRAFWNNVRWQLSFVEDDEGLEWPVGYPGIGCGEEAVAYRPDNRSALDEYLGIRWGEMFVIHPPSS